MLLDIIMLICLYPTLLIMFFTLLNEARPKKNIILGVTIPAEHLDDERIELNIKKFKKELEIYAIIFGLAPLPAFFIKYSSIRFSIFINLTILVIFIMYIPYVKYRQRIMKIKNEEKWYFNDSSEVLVDINEIKTSNEVKIKNKYYIPAIMVSIIPIILEICYPTTNGLHVTIMIVSAIFCITTVMLLLIKNAIYNQKSDIICQNSEVNKDFTRVRSYNFSKAWSVIVYSNAIYEFILYLFMHENIGMFLFVVLTAIYTFVPLCIVMKAEFNTRSVQQKISEKYSKNFYKDDDSFWILGTFYYNKNDKSIMVNNRTGIGTTINMAKPIGKIIAIFTGVIILIVPISCIGMIKSEFTPIKLEINDSKIIAKHTSTEEINIDDIEKIEYLEDINIKNKIMGTNMDTFDKGTFNVEDYGKCELCLNPKIKSYIIINANKKTYILNYGSIEDTKQVYNEILNLTK